MSGVGARPVLGLLFGALACVQAPPVPPGHEACAAARDEAGVTASGNFHVVWANGETYHLVQGDASTRLIVDESLGRPFGGLLRLDRTRVSVTGVPWPGDPAVLCVFTIAPDP
jgi:hypothetical protein